MAETATLDLGTPPAGAPAETNGTTSTAPSFTTQPTTDWRESLPGDLKLDKTLADFKDVGSLAKSYVETKKLVGDAVRIPKPDAKPEELAAFYKRLGVPESPDKYPIELPKLPDGAPGWHEPTIQGFRETAHKAGLTPAQVTQLIGWYATDQLGKRDASAAQSSTASREARAKAQAALEQEWGPQDSPLYQRNKGLARSAVRHLFADDPELAALIEGEGNRPALVKGFAKIGQTMLEDELIDGDFTPAPDKATLDSQIRDARATLARLNPGSRGYLDAKATMDRLYQMRYAGGK
jgi:hypothetical protein